MNTAKRIVLSNSINDKIKLVKNAGGKWYYDASKVDGYGTPSTQPTEWVDLLRNDNKYNVSNMLGDVGDFGADSNADGLANNQVTSNVTGTLINGEQTLIATATSGEHRAQFEVYSGFDVGDVLYACGYYKSTVGKASLYLYNRKSDGAYEQAFVAGTVGATNYEFLSVHMPVTSLYSTQQIIARCHIMNSSGSISFAGAGETATIKQVHVINLTKLFGAGYEPSKNIMDYYVKDYMDNIGYLNGGQINFNKVRPINFAGTLASGYVTTDNKPHWASDGADDRFELQVNPSNDLITAPFAFATTFRTKSALNTGYLFSKAGTNQTEQQFAMLWDAGNSRFTAYVGTSNLQFVFSPATDTTYNAIVFWDGAWANLYINGVYHSRISKAATSVTVRRNFRILVRPNSLDGSTHAAAGLFKLHTLTGYSGSKCTVANVLKAEKEISKKYLG